jgi:membrane protease YdiL (CAAX protease family)
MSDRPRSDGFRRLDDEPDGGERRLARAGAEPPSDAIDAVRLEDEGAVLSCGRCNYCGCDLDPRLYFCPGCATPYKHINTVIPKVKPVPLTDGERIARRAPHAMPVFWTYFSVVLGGAVLSHFLFGFPEPDWASRFVLGQFLVLVTTCVVGAVYWRSLVPQLARVGLLRWETLAGVLALAPLLLINYSYHTWIMDLQHVTRGPHLNPLRESGLSPATLIVLTCVFPAVLEELAMRGLVQHWLQAAIRPAKALVVASALFAVLHFSVLSAPYLFAVGALLGWVKWRTGSLYGPMLIHFLHNYAVLEAF